MEYWRIFMAFASHITAFHVMFPYGTMDCEVMVSQIMRQILNLFLQIFQPVFPIHGKELTIGIYTYSIYIVTQPPVKNELRTKWIYAIPIINRYMQRIGIWDILSSRMGGTGIVPNAFCLLILLRNILTEREPVYGMGRTLDMLFDADRGSDHYPQ